MKCRVTGERCAGDCNTRVVQMTTIQHIDYIADNGLTDWCVYGLAWLRDCVWTAMLGAILLTLALVCVAYEMICKWTNKRKDRKNALQNHWRDR